MPNSTLLNFIRTMSIRPFALVPSALLVLALLPACQQSFAYINIPADHGDVARNDANGGNVPAIEAAALKALAISQKAKAPVTLLLPPGSTYATYQKVAAKAGDVFVLPEFAPADAPVYEVRALRVRGGEAQVDMVTKGEIRPLELTEVNLEMKADLDGVGWRVITQQGRRILPVAATHQAPKPEPIKVEAVEAVEAPAASQAEPTGEAEATE